MTMENITPDEALAALPAHLRQSGKVHMPSEAEAEDFTKKVDDITRLINGLHEGTLPPEYIDRVIEEKLEKENKEKKKEEEKKKKQEEDKKLTPEREAKLKERAAELEASYKRKIKARERFEEYSKENADEKTAGTDYTKWDMWCPSDEEDELISKLTLPDSAEFKAMEKDIDERHAKQIKSRQIAERCRVKGNEEYKNGQWASSYDWYTEGLSHEKPNVALNSNAAMASIKMGCYVQAIEHADKAIRICDFLLEKPDHPLKVKALQRKATARMALKHYKEAVDALEEAAQLEPENSEVAKQFVKAKEEYEEDKKERQLSKAVDGSQNGEDSSMATLRRLEELVKSLRNACAEPRGETVVGGEEEAAKGSPAGLGGGLPGKTPAPKAAQAADAAAAASCELIPLLDEDDSNRVYLRQCGGLDALVNLVRKGKRGGVSDKALEEAIGALRAALLNPRNTSAAAAKGLYPALVSIVATGGDQEATASLEARGSAALLLGNCTTDEDERKAVSKALAGSLNDVMPLLATAVSSPLAQASVLVLLQNCAVDKQVREAFSKAQGNSGVDPGTPLGSTTELLSAPQAVIRERAASLLGNLLMDASLRQRGSVAGSIACRVLNTLAATEKKAPEADEVLLPLLAVLSNCLLEAAAAEEALSGTGAPQKRIGALAGLLDHRNPAVAGRALGSLARLVRHEPGRDAFVGGPALSKVIAALSSAAAEVSSSEGASRSAKAEVIGGSCRALALAMTAGGAQATDAAVSAGAIGALLKSIAAPGTPDAAAGNAALALSEVARHPGHLSALREADAVEPLVTCAHKRDEKTTQKNAAIALARMAQDPACLQRLKDLHGLEIIYQTAK